MKKLIEFQETKHNEVLDAISKFREDNGTTFSESVRRLILLGQNGAECPEIPETTIYTAPDPKVEEIEDKLDKLHTIVVKHIKKHTEEENE
jgi:hypothetical protein